MPLSSPPPVSTEFGQEPPHDSHSATPQRTKAKTARTTADPTVGPSRRLGLPPITRGKLDPRAVGKAGSEARSPHVPRNPSRYLSLKARMRSLKAALSRAYTPCARAWTMPRRAELDRVNDGL